MKHSDDHWLVRPRTITWLWRGFAVVLALTVAAEFLVKIKGYFGIDEWLGFGAVFGFLSCLLMVLVAKALGYALKRPEAHYRSRGDD